MQMGSNKSKLRQQLFQSKKQKQQKSNHHNSNNNYHDNRIDPHNVKNPQQKAQMIIEKCKYQNNLFKKWAQQKKWSTFHSSHYDWWAFPYDQGSSQGKLYQLFNQQIEIMSSRPDFLIILKQNAILVCLAWGYNISTGQLIPTNYKNQSWQQHAIRLYKMSRSLQIFNIEKEFENSIKYGIMLLEENYQLTYGKKNFTHYYQKEWENIKIKNKKKDYNEKKQQENEKKQFKYQDKKSSL